MKKQKKTGKGIHGKGSEFDDEDLNKLGLALGITGGVSAAAGIAYLLAEDPGMVLSAIAGFLESGINGAKEAISAFFSGIPVAEIASAVPGGIEAISSSVAAIDDAAHLVSAGVPNLDPNLLNVLDPNHLASASNDLANSVSDYAGWGDSIQLFGPGVADTMADFAPDSVDLMMSGIDNTGFGRKHKNKKRTKGAGRLRKQNSKEPVPFFIKNYCRSHKL